MRQLLAVLLVSANATVLLVGTTIGNDNERLVTAAKKAAATLEFKIDTGKPILPEKYFLERINQQFEIAPGAKLSLRDSQRLMLVCTEIAAAMLKVAEPDRDTEAEYVTGWAGAKIELQMRLANTEFGLTPNMLQLWQKAGEQWQTDVILATPLRFRDALRQAAYSLLRVGLDIEGSWIAKVRGEAKVAPATIRQANKPSVINKPSVVPAPVTFPDTRLYNSHRRKLNRITREIKQ